MKHKILRFQKVYINIYLLKILYTVAGILIGAVTLYTYLMNNRPDLYLWHTIYLDEEFTIEKQAEIASFDDYLAVGSTATRR